MRTTYIRSIVCIHESFLREILMIVIFAKVFSLENFLLYGHCLEINVSNPHFITLTLRQSERAPSMHYLCTHWIFRNYDTSVVFHVSFIVNVYMYPSRIVVYILGGVHSLRFTYQDHVISPQHVNTSTIISAWAEQDIHTYMYIAEQLASCYTFTEWLPGAGQSKYRVSLKYLVNCYWFIKFKASSSTLPTGTNFVVHKVM